MIIVLILIIQLKYATASVITEMAEERPKKQKQVKKQLMWKEQIKKYIRKLYGALSSYMKLKMAQ